MIVNQLEHVLTRWSLWVLDRLDGGLAVGENDICIGLVVADGPSQCHLDAAELGSVHRGLALRVSYLKRLTKNINQ